MNQLDFWHADIDLRNIKHDLQVFRLSCLNHGQNALRQSHCRILKLAIFLI